MENSETPAAALHSIAVVERLTGLGKDTLRVWERRYAFPQPERDAHGERIYSLEQVDKLRLLKHLIDNGHRPGKIIHLEFDALHKLRENLLAAGAATDISADRADLQEYLGLCKAHRVEDLRRGLSQALLRMGLEAFVMEVIAPLTRLVGEYWVRGIFAVHEEHLYTEVVQNLLRSAISAIFQRQGHTRLHPHIMLTTFPEEPHALGLLMAEAIFSLAGARCISLGVQTPVIDIAQAAARQQADIVALSFSSVMPSRQVLDGLAELRNALRAEVEIWAGGGNAALSRLSPQLAHVIALPDISPKLGAWRQRHAAD